MSREAVPVASRPSDRPHSPTPGTEPRHEIDALAVRLKNRPNDPSLLQERAETYMKIGDADRALADWERAIADCDDALRLSPGHAEASLNGAMSLLALNDSRRHDRLRSGP